MPHGTVLEERASESGILRVEAGDFAGTLAAAIGDWLADAPTAPVIASGMIGSRQGWMEVPYATCPAGLPELALGLGRVPGPDGRAVHIVPGALRAASGGEFPDVMRGEETQIMGDLAARPRGAARYVLPGTHSKWAWCEEGRLVGFATYMTGELYDVLRRHSILGRLMSGDAPDDDAFGQGLDRARRSAGAPPGRLLHDLFSTRTFGLVGTLPGSALASYLSGLLIGGEILAATLDVRRRRDRRAGQRCPDRPLSARAGHNGYPRRGRRQRRRRARAVGDRASSRTSREDDRCMMLSPAPSRNCRWSPFCAACGRPRRRPSATPWSRPDSASSRCR